MMTKEKLTELKEAGQQAVSEARAITETAQNEKRELTPTEKSEYEAVMTRARGLLDQIKAAQADLAVFDAAKELAGEIGGPNDGPADGFKDSGKRLSFKTMASEVTRKMLPKGVGAKALVPAGNITTVVGQGFTPSPIELGKPGTSLLDALPVEIRATPTWKYLRQTVRTNNAAVVAEGAVKPTSVYSVTEVDGTLSVVAHLSEAIPRYYFVDNSSLEDFVRSELEYGLQLAVEAKAMADINATSGIQVQAFATDVLATLRKTITKLEGVGYSPQFFVLHPTDWESIDLLKDAEDRYYFGGPQAIGTRRLWDVPVVVSLAQAAGVSHTIAAETVAVDTDSSGVQVQWSEESNADDFSRNLIRARCEGRFATSVFRPMGVVVGDLTA